MKNSPFRKTFIGGLTILFIAFLFLLVILVNVFNAVYNYIEDKKRNEPKVIELLIEDVKPESKPNTKVIDTPKIKSVNKIKEKVIDTPVIPKPKDTILDIDTTIVKK